MFADWVLAIAANFPEHAASIAQAALAVRETQALIWARSGADRSGGRETVGTEEFDAAISACDHLYDLLQLLRSAMR